MPDQAATRYAWMRPAEPIPAADPFHFAGHLAGDPVGLVFGPEDQLIGNPNAFLFLFEGESPGRDPLSVLRRPGPQDGL